MLRRFCVMVLIAAIVLVACTPLETDHMTEPLPEPTLEPTAIPKPEPDQDEPMDGQEPSKEEPVVGQAYVENVEILLLESFPVQVNVVVSGSLPDGCSAIHEISQERIGNTIEITITTIRRADVACTEALVPFEEVISVDVTGLPAGEYTVLVNGVEAYFELAVDNPWPEGEQGKPADLLTREAYVDEVTVQVLEGTPPQVNVTVYGNLPDGCSSIGDVVVLQDENSFNVMLMSQRPADRMCITVLTPYEHSFTLGMAGLEAGTYTVEVNGVTANFDLP